MAANANAVDVDDAAIDASLNVLGARPLESEPSPLPDAELEGARLAVDWGQALEGATQLLAKIVVPNWQLTDDEQQLITTQGAKVLEAFWPNLVIEGKWLALFSFGLCTGGIVLNRFDLETLTFLPGRIVVVHVPAAAEPVAAVRPVRQPTAAADRGAPDARDRVVASPWAGHGS